VRYFFITDRIASKDVSVEYCPTGDMIADFFTKPLQGALFWKLRDEIMNTDPKLVPTMDHSSVLDKRTKKGLPENEKEKNKEWITVQKRRKNRTQTHGKVPHVNYGTRDTHEE
jgi:hypothetical protein